MNSNARWLPWLIGVGLMLLLLCIGLALGLAAMKQRDARRSELPVLGQVADFVLTNQHGAAVTLSALRGRVWVADIIFTRCAGPCPRMTRQMQELQSALPAESGTRLVSLTTDPVFDTPPVLKKYAERFGADTNRWMFLTGTKREIGGLARDGLKLASLEKVPGERTSPEDLFIHSTIFVVVGRQGRLRGVFQTGGEGVDWAVEKQKILGAIGRLEREE